MEEFDEPSNETKRIIVMQEVSICKNTLYQLKIRYKVNKLVDSSPEVLAGIDQEMSRIVRMIDLYGEELASLV